MLLNSVKRDGFAVLNGDDPRVLAMAKNAPCSVVTVGTSPEFQSVRLECHVKMAGPSCL